TTIGNSVTSIESLAFYGCESLTEISVSSENADYSSENGVLFNKDKTKIVRYLEGKKDLSYSIPDSVTSIGDWAFENCTSLTSVTIPDSVTSIGFCAFSDCTSLTSVTIGSGVTSIGSSAFSNCTSLTSVTIPDSVTSIGIGAFYGCTSLASVTIPESVTAIDWFAFGYDEAENLIDNFKIYGKVGSEAERYADDNSIEFISIDGTPAKSFPDVSREDWYYSAAKYCLRNEYIKGYEDGRFGPANTIQRQDFVLILARIAGADLSAYEGQNGGFSDVQAGSYYASAVAWAKDTGVVNGFSADNFGVGTYISREQICIMLCRYLNGSVLGNADTILNAYPDGGNTSPWAKESVAWAVENGIIGNSYYLNPTGNAGRAEVAQIIYNMSNNGML
ncbi:MAG: leucine-rich repeat protein, partial [Oscillospiraceae bacterium]|nr:leucine-rich repeat protein [Oscillospiraceae bacterium]